MEVTANGTHDDFPGIESDADYHRHPLRPLNLVGIPGDSFLHPQRRITCAHRVVLLGERGAEESHDAIAHDLVDGALVAVDGLHHPLEDGIENLAGLLRIAVGEQLHGALEIGEEDSDLLAFALHGCLRGEDLLGDVLRCVCLRRVKTRALRRARRLAALAAELGAGTIRFAARSANHLEADSALVAEGSISGVVVLAPGTLHPETLLASQDWPKSPRTVVEMPSMSKGQATNGRRMYASRAAGSVGR